MERMTKIGLKGLALLLIMGCQGVNKTEELNQKKLNSTDYFIDLGWVEYYNGNLDSSIAYYEWAIALLDSNNPLHLYLLEDAYNGLGFCYLAKGDTTKRKEISEETYNLNFNNQ